MFQVSYILLSCKGEKVELVVGMFCVVLIGFEPDLGHTTLCLESHFIYLSVWSESFHREIGALEIRNIDLVCLLDISLVINEYR